MPVSMYQYRKAITVLGKTRQGPSRPCPCQIPPDVRQTLRTPKHLHLSCSLANYNDGDYLPVEQPALARFESFTLAYYQCGGQALGPLLCSTRSSPQATRPDQCRLPLTKLPFSAGLDQEDSVQMFAFVCSTFRILATCQWQASTWRASIWCPSRTLFACWLVPLSPCPSSCCPNSTKTRVVRSLRDKELEAEFAKFQRNF